LNIDPDKAQRLSQEFAALASNPRKPKLLREAAHEALAKLRTIKFPAPLNTGRRGGV
jgi:hypothetical protein